MSNDITWQVDVYAYGITVFELFSKHSAWQKLPPMEVRSHVIEGKRPEISITTAEILGEHFKFLANLVATCWTADPYRRPRFSVIEATLATELNKVGL